MNEELPSPARLADLRLMYYSGRACEKPKTSRYREWGYVNYAVTPSGEIEISEWERQVEEIIEEAHDEAFFQNVLEWVRKHVPWCQTEDEVRRDALSKYSNRLFDDEAWVDFLPFNEKYRPERLNDVEIRPYISRCKYTWHRKNPGRATAALIAAHKDTGTLPCPDCGAWMPYSFDLEEVNNADSIESI